MKIQSYSTKLYRTLGEEVDYPMNYHVTGAIRLAHSRQRMEEFRHVEAMGRQMGVEFQEMSPSEMQEVYHSLKHMTSMAVSGMPLTVILTRPS